MRECVQHLCHVCVYAYLCLCMSVCMYVCGHVLMGVCACVLTCIYAAFTHVSMHVYYLCTIHVRPYTYVAYAGYILAQRRAANAGGPGPQGCALAAASSALRRLHSLQLLLM